LWLPTLPLLPRLPASKIAFANYKFNDTRKERCIVEQEVFALMRWRRRGSAWRGFVTIRNCTRARTGANLAAWTKACLFGSGQVPARNTLIHKNFFPYGNFVELGK
jgi:hypothetical protein